MTNAHALRLRLLRAGFSVIPLFGKAPPQYGKNNPKRGLTGWTKLENITPEMLDMWAKTWPNATNTGVLTKYMPTLDVDVLDEAAAQVAAEFVYTRHAHTEHLLTRVGKPPKFAIPFRTDKPFKKITVSLIAPDGSDGQKVEFLGDGEQVVVDGIHPDTGKPYSWHGGKLAQTRHEDLPYVDESEAKALVNEIVDNILAPFGYKRAPSRAKTNGGAPTPAHDGGGGGDRDWQTLFENIRTGRELHDSLCTLAAKMIVCGTNSGAAINQLRALMDASTATKDDRWRARVSEIPAAVDSAVAKYGKAEPMVVEAKPAEPAVAEVKPPASTHTIEDAIKVFRSWLVLSSSTPVYAVLGTVAANLLPGDPVWLGLIAPPSSAKTELLNSISGLPHVVQAATITPSGLLSGTPKKQHDKGARGGLLRQIGTFGIICLKDFGSVLSMHAETRAETLAAMREVYDGAWTRHLGSAGGESLSWNGKVAIIFAATEVIDAHHSVIGAMGDRFLISRLKPVTGKKQFTCALKHAGTGIGQMRKELAAAVKRLFDHRRPETSQINAEETEAIGKAIALAVRLRGAVARDYRSREIEAIYGAEGTARIGLALERLLAGLETLGMDRKQALTIVKEVALDSVPPLRRRAYDTVCKYTDVQTDDISIALGLPTNSARRILEDLEAHGLITRTTQGPGKPHLWNKSTWEADEAAADAKED
jgi:hypothetical protein